MQGDLNCTEARQIIPWLLDDELDATSSLLIEDHLNECESCRHFIEREGELRLVVRRAAGTVIAPRSLRARVSETVKAQPGASLSASRFWPAAAAAAVLLTFIAQGYFDGVKDDWEVFMGRHARDLPMDVQAAEHAKVQRYFQGRLPFSFQLPRFSEPRDSSGLLGGRVTQVKDQDAAYVRYQLPGGNLSVFVYEDRGRNFPEVEVLQRRGDGGVVMRQLRGYSVARWKQKGIVYSVISDLPEREFRTALHLHMNPR
ncbi:MAG: zf-HC2 domain-containing protein [Myxococcota bacterium]|nr:zf-HC2 domain-containing protein [Myxococcota bacterium]